jgi:hypothetical protein
MIVGSSAFARHLLAAMLEQFLEQVKEVEAKYLEGESTD